MKILQRNDEKAPEHWRAQVYCGRCGSILEVEEEDLKRYCVDDRMEQSDDAWFSCGACDTPNIADVPSLVKERMKPSAPPSSSFVECISVTQDLPHQTGRGQWI